MQPMGRKSIQLPDAKHKPKDNGKHLVGWWEYMGSENKKAERQQTKKDIEKEMQL